MDVKNTKLKKIIVIGIVFIGIFGLIRNYNKYKEIKNNQKILIENRDELNKKILEIEKQREMERSKIRDEYDQLTIWTEKFNILSVRNEAEFKKMIYIFARESNLKLKEVSKSEKLCERNGYRLKYIHFNLYGSLNDLGKFLFFVNKSKKYVDTSKMYIKLTREEFRISLGFIEKI